MVQTMSALRAGQSTPLWTAAVLLLLPRCRAQLAVPAGQSNSTWLTIGGAFAGIGIGVVVLICFLMVCFDRRRHSQGSRRVTVRRPLADLRPVSRQPQNVSIPVVVVSPSGDIELAKSVLPEDFAVQPSDGKADCQTKGSEIVIVTHGEPAFAEADVINLHHKLAEDDPPGPHAEEGLHQCQQRTADQCCNLGQEQSPSKSSGGRYFQGISTAHGSGIRARDDTAGDECRIEVHEIDDDGDARDLDASHPQDEARPTAAGTQAAARSQDIV